MFCIKNKLYENQIHTKKNWMLRYVRTVKGRKSGKNELKMGDWKMWKILDAWQK